MNTLQAKKKGAANHRFAAGPAENCLCHACWHSTLQLLAPPTPCLQTADPHATQNYRTRWPQRRHQSTEHIRAHSTLCIYLCIQKPHLTLLPAAAAEALGTACTSCHLRYTPMHAGALA